MNSLFNSLSEINDKDVAIRRLKDKKFRNDIDQALEAPKDVMEAIKEHRDKDDILHGLVYMLPLSLPLLRLLPVNELSGEKIKDGFAVVCNAMEDTLTDYSELLLLPDTEQQDAVIAQAKIIEAELHQLKDKHLARKKEIREEEVLLEKKNQQILGLKQQIASLEEKLAQEKRSLKQAKEEEQSLRERMKNTGSELEGQRELMEKQTKKLRSISQQLKKVEKNKKFTALSKKMDKLLVEAESMRPDDELSKLAAEKK